MDIVVCVKTNPDLQMVRIKNREAVLEAVPYKLGDLEKNALEAAVVLRDAAGGKVTAVCVAEGNRKVKETIKDALAIGADEAVVIDDPALAAPDPAAVAQALAAAVQKLGHGRPGAVRRGLDGQLQRARCRRAWPSCSAGRRSATRAASRPRTAACAASAAWTT